MMSGNMGFMDLWQQYWPRLCLGQYCCLKSIKLHIALITGPYLYNIDIHDHATCTQHSIHPNRTRHEYAKKCQCYDLSKVIKWNSSSNFKYKINTHCCLKCFAAYIKYCIFQSYQETCATVNCYICNRN